MTKLYCCKTSYICRCSRRRLVTGARSQSRVRLEPCRQSAPSRPFFFRNLIRSKIASKLRMVCGPKYDGKYLRALLRRHLGDTTLDRALTNVVIPTFDIAYLQPTIFSTFELKYRPAKNALLSDISISTSAAPTFFPPHYFETKDENGRRRAFNLVDGGLAANNPTLCAMNQVSQDIILGNDHFFPVEPVDYGKFLVISLGCGSNRNRRYCAKAVAKWGIFDWLFKNGTAPIVDMFNSASADMVDIHLCVLFHALRSSENYLRIQLPCKCSTID
ncbi:unnamed protein product [Urochloa decumbens]|uniref:Patatin n=1 Tax=Urochloa decumbens TaxID=240449 RepID=A0ABC9BJE5_9POAL